VIYTAEDAEQLALNFAAILWRGQYIRAATARRLYRRHKKQGGKLTFAQFVADLNLRILD